jgi:hypothetical protein
MRRVGLALVHHPVRARAGETITTAITNLDLHDMARSACTYGLSDLFVVHPVGAQRDLVERVRDHWLTGSGAKRIPDRVLPMKLMRVVASLDEAFAAFGGGRGGVCACTTSAQARPGTVSWAEARARMREPGPPVMLLFGTGWGLAESVERDADVRLEPIGAAADTGFNHLSVRAACAIALDRLFGAGR